MSADRTPVEDPKRRMQARAADVLPRLVDELDDWLADTTRHAFSDDDRRELARFLARAWTAGSHAGTIEIAAQLVEQGIDVHINLIDGAERD